MMKIFLIVPYTKSHYFVPPIGLGYLATALRKNNFLNVTIIDGVKDFLTIDKFKNIITRERPDIVGFQVFSSDVYMVQKYMKILTKVHPWAITLIGGAHASGVKKELFKDFPTLDLGFRGEAEKGLPMLLKIIEASGWNVNDNEKKKKRKKNTFEKNNIIKNLHSQFYSIPGLMWRNERYISENELYFEKSLDSLGLPAWDLMDIRTYPQAPQGAIFRNWPIAPILTSRGCPYNCTYCANKLGMGQSIRTRSVSNIIKEVKLLYTKYGMREIHIIDDTFTSNRDRVIEFCNRIIKNKIRVSIAFPNGIRLNTIDDELLATLKKAGCYSITIGIESGSDKILRDMKKALTIKMIKEKMEIIKRNGLHTTGFFILGYPTENKETILETIRFAKELPLHRAHFSTFLPLPGTDITNQLINDGELKKINWAKLFYTEAPFPPKGMTSKELKRLQRKAFVEFYLRPRIIWMMMCEIRSWTHFKSLFKRAWDYAF